MAIFEQLQHQQVSAIRVGRFNQGINTTFVVYQLFDTLIDTGPVNQWRYVKHFAQQQQVKQVLLTHFHEDHSGNAFGLQQAGVHVLAPKLTQQLITKPYKMPLIQKIIWGTPKGAEVELMPEQIFIGEQYPVTKIPVPGHCDEMYAYLLADKGWLFSGDLYIAGKVKYLHRHENFTEQVASLKRALSYDFEVMFCPHRGIVQNGKQALANKLDYLENLIAKAKQLHQQGIDIKHITTKLLGKEDGLYYLSGGEFAKHHLITACIAV